MPLMNADQRRWNNVNPADRRSSAFIGGCQVLAGAGH